MNNVDNANNADIGYQSELVKRTCEGDITAFHEIVDLHKKKVYYIAFNLIGDFHEAEDISQEVFIKVFRFIKKFRAEAKLSTWIYQIAVNTSLDAVRKLKDKQVLMETGQMESLPPAADSGSEASGPENQAARELFRRRLQRALPGLSKKEQAVFALRYFNEFKLAEISEIMDISINTIKTLLMRAKKKLRKKLARYNPEMTYEGL